MVKYILVALFSAYFGAGFFGGLLMKQSIPALNYVGIAYIAITWPMQIYCARLQNNCISPHPSIAPYMFTFKEVS